MGFFLRGALVEYGTDFMGPLPNIVVFQFNPETITRSFNFPGSAAATTETAARQREPSQVSAPPAETFPLTLHFSAVEDLGSGGLVSAIPRVFGVGPQLAALEKMVFPTSGLLSKLIGEAVDAIGDALGGGDDSAPTRPTPREQAPRILFIWGPSRVLPVRITSLSITEQQFDVLLNPIQAQVEVGLAIASFPENSDDKLGKGALTYTNTVKDAQAVLNLAKAVELALDIIPF